MRAFWIAVAMTCLGAAGAFLLAVWPRSLRVAAPRVVQVTEVTATGPRIYMPGRVLIGRLGEYADPLFAFLMFDHDRSLPELRNVPVVLRSGERHGAARYSIWVRLPDDLIRGTFQLAGFRADGLTSEVRYRWITPREYQRDVQRTKLVTAAYSDPAPDALERLDHNELLAYLSSFIRFKSLTDFRIEHQTDPSLSPLSREQATRLAGNIMAVARFYQVPLSLMVGIGAMENNYMNAPGDLTHTIWKRRAERGDIVLKRRRHRVLVKDDSLGVWQITRKELRKAQRLYRKDRRDYAELPPWLRPPRRLDWKHIPPAVLTTYAGLLLRDLLDHCHENVMKAAGAYNGTQRHPNLRYAEGVQLVAEYAQRVAGNAAVMHPVIASATIPEVAIPRGSTMEMSLVETEPRPLH